MCVMGNDTNPPAGNFLIKTYIYIATNSGLIASVTIQSCFTKVHLPVAIFKIH